MPGLFELVSRNVWRKQLHKIKHVPAQDDVLAKSDPCRAAWE